MEGVGPAAAQSGQETAELQQVSGRLCRKFRLAVESEVDAIYILCKSVMESDLKYEQTQHARNEVQRVTQPQAEPVVLEDDWQ